MIVEERIYSLHPGQAPEYLRLYEAEGLEIQRAILGRMVGYFSTEVGPLNQIVHMWAYRDLASAPSVARVSAPTPGGRPTSRRSAR
jgi:hypothetical protein